MGRQIIKQPNGKYAVWSTIVDNFIFVDATPDDIIEFYVQEYRDEIGDKVRRQVAQLEKGEKPYYQFTMSWQEALNTIKSVHGNKALKELESEIIE